MQSVIADSFNTTTLLGSHLWLSSLLPVNFDLKREDTINAHLNIFPNEEFSEVPKLRYFGVGIRGCYNADDEILSSAYNPSRVNMNLFGLIPIRCVPIDEDLPDAERAHYRLRQRKVIGTEECFLYYLKLMEFDSAGIRFKRINNSTGEEIPYELNPEYLSPTPVKPSTNNTIETTDSSIVAYCNATVNLKASEVLEYINRRYDGDTRWARISEIGFFSGVDKQVTGSSGQGVPFSYNEAIYTMLYEHLTWTGTPLTHVGSNISSVFEITSSGAIIKS